MKQLLLQAVLLYQKWVSPLLGPRCRFRPTCSEYMYQAINRYGALRGLWLGLKRLLRCHPFSGGSFEFDPLD